MLQVLRERHLTPVPLLYASTCPGGPLTRATYELKGEILERLRAVLPVDGVLLPSTTAPRRGPDRRGARAGWHGYAGGGHPRPARPRHRGDGAWRRRPAGLGDLPPRRRRLHPAARCPAAGRHCGRALPAHHGDGQGAGGDRRDHRLHRERRYVRLPDAPRQGAGVRCRGAVHQHVPGAPYLDLPDMGSGALAVTDADPTRAAQLPPNCPRNTGGAAPSWNRRSTPPIRRWPRACRWRARYCWWRPPPATARPPSRRCPAPLCPATPWCRWSTPSRRAPATKPAPGAASPWRWAIGSIRSGASRSP